MTYKVKIMALIAVITGVTLLFNACGDKEELENQVEKSTEIGIIIPDGTYIGKLGDIVIENTFKDNKLIDRKVNGEEVDIQYAPRQKSFDSEQEAMACVGRLDNNGWPCITLYSLDNFFGTDETLWVVEYSDYDAGGNCWYDKYNL